MSENRRGSYAKTAQRRRAVAAAAVEILREAGLAGLTTSDVARRAGISERSLFYHFPTRDHILVAALESADEAAAIESIDSYEETNEHLGHLIESLVAAASGEPWKAALTVSLSGAAQDPDHPAHDYFVRHYATALSGFAEVVRRRQAAGLAHPDLDPEQVARHFVAAWEGLQAQWLVTQSFDLSREVVAAFRHLSGQGLMEFRRVFDSFAAGAS